MVKKFVKPVPEMARKTMFLGALLFLVGLMRYYNMSWPEVLMIVGAILFVKGLFFKYRLS